MTARATGHSALEFSPAAKERLEWLRSRYPEDHQRALVLPVLSMAQREFGWVSPEVVRFVADQIPVPSMWVEEVATFYTTYNKQPTGRWHLQVCHNVSCSLMGAEIVIEHLEGRLGIHAGQTTDDGEFTLTRAECLGSCGTAPMLQVNDQYRENLSLQAVDDLLEELRDTPDQSPKDEDLAVGPGSGPGRELPRHGRPLESGRDVHVPHYGDEPIPDKVAARPKEKAAVATAGWFEPQGMAR